MFSASFFYYYCQFCGSTLRPQKRHHKRARAHTHAHAHSLRSGRELTAPRSRDSTQATSQRPHTPFSQTLPKPLHVFQKLASKGPEFVYLRTGSLCVYCDPVLIIQIHFMRINLRFGSTLRNASRQSSRCVSQKSRRRRGGFIRRARPL